MTVVYAPKVFAISLSASPTEGGTVSGGGEFDENTAVTVTAVPKVGYHFVKWTEGETAVGTETEYRFTATADRSLTAVFERDYVQLPELPADAIATEAWVDGQRLDLTDGKLYDLPTDGSAQMVTGFTYSSDAPDAYPTAMYVWSLRYENGKYTATRIEELDNILKYEGMSIRVPNYGIRMISSVPDALRSRGLAGYTLEEYGTQVKGPNNTVSAAAYKRGVQDSVYKQSGGRTYYTNVLVDFPTKEDCLKELNLRPYVVLSKDGETFTLYGGWVQRSIWYVAKQNRDSFPAGSAYDQYIEQIIAYKNS